MKTISIKNFQKNIYAHIKELPCVITKNGKPCFKVESYSSELPQVATIRPVKVATKVAAEFLEDHAEPSELKPVYSIGNPLWSDKPLPGYKFISYIGKYKKT